MTTSTLLAIVCLACAVNQLVLADVLTTASPNLGEPQSIIQCKADVVFCIDNSGSIRDNNPPGGDNWRLILNFVQALLKQVGVKEEGTHVAVVTFGERGHVEFDLQGNQTEEDTLKLVSDLKYRGENTNTTGGLYWSRQILTDSKYGSRKDVAKVIILITDGVPTYDKDKLQAEVDIIKNSLIRIVSVGVTNKINETLLKSIATTPRDYVYGNDFSGLDLIKDVVINEQTCQKIILTTTAPPTTTTEMTEPPTTTPVPAMDSLQIACDSGVDLMFVIDATRIDNSMNLTLIKEFLIKTITEELEAGKVSVGFVTASNSTEPDFYLNRYDERLELAAGRQNFFYAAGGEVSSNSTGETTGETTSYGETTTYGDMTTDAQHE